MVVSADFLGRCMESTPSGLSLAHGIVDPWCFVTRDGPWMCTRCAPDVHLMVGAVAFGQQCQHLSSGDL